MAAGPSDPVSIWISSGSLTAVGNTLYFVGNDGAGYQLWETNGTALGTARLTGSGGTAGLAIATCSGLLR